MCIDASRWLLRGLEKYGMYIIRSEWNLAYSGGSDVRSALKCVAIPPLDPANPCLVWFGLV